MQTDEKSSDRGDRFSIPLQNSAPFSVAPSAETSGIGSPTFAGMLSALTAPEKDKLDEPLEWANDDPADDAATLSYEHALRARGSFRPEDWPGMDPESPESAMAEIAVNANAGSVQSTESIEETDRKRRSASVTVRLSRAECMQLKKRAADAGLTISAYLRSCTFEAEALRSQVKEALAALRTASSEEKQSAPFPALHVPRRWWQIRSPSDPHSTRA
jgi:Mobilization protein NikA